MVQTVLPQLQEVVTNLEIQESTLTKQMEEIRAKKEALEAVIPMFEADSTESADSADVAKVPATAAKSVAKKTKAATDTKTAAKKTKAASKSKAGAKKKDGRAASWQKYALPGVKDRPMPESVQIVLATKPDEDFKIAEVMSALFKDGMPKAQYLKARNRISNILSGGVRDGDWFKGDRGAYRLNKPA
ncbi:MAG: hypothetical protein AAFV85_23835 [Cyanobacteria bacterium J06634_6]